MIQDYEKYRVEDQNKTNDFFIEVNWASKNKKTNDCKILKFTFPNGDVSYIKREHLHFVFMAFGTPAQQRDLVPQEIRQVEMIEYMVPFKPKRNLKAGETVMHRVVLRVPKFIDHVYSGNLK